MSLDDIWAEPIVETTKSITRPSNQDVSEKTRAALFLSDSEDEGVDNVSRSHISPHPAVSMRDNNTPQGLGKEKLDAMFAGVDDDDLFDDVAPVDIESLKRQADAKVAATHKGILPSTSSSWREEGNATLDKDKEAKGAKTRVMPKLDEERLLGHDGFPRLLKEHKSFKVTGKGHESADLARLFRIYHAWTHKMYPKFQFRDTVDRVEKLCRSRRMTVNLKVWRDEAHGIKPEVRHEVSQYNDENNSDRDSDEVDHDQPLPGLPSPSSTRPSTPMTRPASAASTAPSVPSSATDNDDGMDIDALLREEEEIMREMNAAEKGGSSYKLSNPEDDEDTLRAAVSGTANDVPDMNTQLGLTPTISHDEVEDEDMWNMLDEMNKQRPAPKDSVDNGKEVTTVISEPAAPSAPEAPQQNTIGADWDDMYE